ncbi:putative 21 kDa protein-like [Iris pallida]|uniref:21 kDa protein-like n=1 Tax=Iris pallida TaxID=29817 RepID=A0AAX6H395_IRIPA|nr:putative 21 kDa protein-like [Iris pallida]
MAAKWSYYSSLLVLLLAYAYAAEVQSLPPSPFRDAPALDFIRTSCNSTLYPSLCFASLSPYANAVGGSPVRLAHLAVNVTGPRPRPLRPRLRAPQGSPVGTHVHARVGRPAGLRGDARGRGGPGLAVRAGAGPGRPLPVRARDRLARVQRADVDERRHDQRADLHRRLRRSGRRERHEDRRLRPRVAAEAVHEQRPRPRQLSRRRLGRFVVLFVARCLYALQIVTKRLCSRSNRR